MKTQTTSVVFRTFKGIGKETIALFPYEVEQGGYGRILCQSFQHIGQHGAADYDNIIRQTRPATSEEITELTAELTNAPYSYDLRPILKINRNMLGNAIHKFRLGY